MPQNFCPECGAKAQAGAKFCPECGQSYGGPAPSSQSLREEAGPPSSRAFPPSSRSPVSLEDATEPASDSVITRSDVETRSTIKDSVVSRSTVRAGGPIEDSVVSRSDIQTKNAGIRDTVISHSTITQTETHQHFGESVGTFDAQMDLGRTAFEGKNWQEAVDFFNTALKIDSKGFEPWYFKGMSCAELRRTDEAVTNLRRALRLAGPKSQTIIDQVKALSDRIARMGQLQENSANELIGKARLELQNSLNYQAQAKSGKETGLAGALALDLLVIPGLGSSMRTTNAVEGMEKRQEADKREAEGRRLEDQAKTHASEAVKLYNAAIRYCDLVIEHQKQDEFSWLKRGELYFRLRLYDDSCKSYESILSFNPNHRDALRMRGLCFPTPGQPVPPPPGAVPPQATLPPNAPTPAAPGASFPPPDKPKPASPMIPQPVPPAAQPAIQIAPQQVMMPPVQPGRATQMAPAQPSAPPHQPVYPAHPASPPAQPGAYQAPPARQAAPSQQYPLQPPNAPQYGMPGSMPAKQAGPNPCPYCRGDMSFLREKGVWQCGSCRQFSAKPAR